MGFCAEVREEVQEGDVRTTQGNCTKSEKMTRLLGKGENDASERERERERGEGSQLYPPQRLNHLPKQITNFPRMITHEPVPVLRVPRFLHPEHQWKEVVERSEAAVHGRVLVFCLSSWFEVGLA